MTAATGKAAHRHSQGAADALAPSAFFHLLPRIGNRNGAVRRGPAGRIEVQRRLLLSRANRARGGAGPGAAGCEPDIPAAGDAHAAAQRAAAIVICARSPRPVPRFMAKAFPDLHFLSPLLDFSKGYGVCPAMEEMAVRDLGMSRELAAQRMDGGGARPGGGGKRRLRGLGQKTLDEAVADGKLAILLAGHSYSAFAPEASQSVARKLSSMGVTVIPGDCLTPVEAGPTAWHFANQILNAAAIAKAHPNLFLLCVSNFSCTIDAFTQSILASVMGSKPHLILEIDAHTADAGIQTRLEAFLDIAANYQATANQSHPRRSHRLPVGLRAAASSEAMASPLGWMTPA